MSIATQSLGAIQIMPDTFLANFRAHVLFEWHLPQSFTPMLNIIEEIMLNC